ncbi:MAG: Ig-like domain-containing protein [Lachnospiraceae bacterium]|nr:Ig-like domain-containing protein [Lachnospiraceae bacterium]
MNELKKMFRAKRILAMFLAFAMTVQSVPITAKAAEVQESGDVVESASDEIIEEVVEESGSAETGQDEKSEGNVNETLADAAQGTGSDENDRETEPDENAAQETASDEKNENKDITADEGKSNSSATAEIVIDYVRIQNRINNNYGNYSYDTETKTIICKYSKNNSNPFEDIVNDIKNDYIKVNLDYNNNAELKTHLNYLWVDSTGNELDGAGPVDAGDYRLKISLPVVEGVYDKEEIFDEINFRIDKHDVGVEYNGSTSVVPGTSVEAVKEDVKESYTLNIEGMLLDSSNKDAYIQSDEVTIKDAHSDTILNDSDRLIKTEDYVVELTIVFKEEYAKNYTVTNCIANINMGDTIATEIMVQNDVNQDGSNFGKVYDTKCIDEKAIHELLGATVIEVESGDEIPEAEITYTWIDANRNELESYEDVKDAGTYYIVLHYAGKEGYYHASRKEVKVVISTADIAIEPVLKTGITYYAGMTVKDILKKAVDTYNVYQMNNKDNMTDEAFTAAVKADPYFWGISYNDTEKTQSYEPVFAVEEGVVTIEEDGKETISWNVLEDENAVLVKEDDVKYRVVFSGKKAVYTSVGTKHSVDINASQENYRVDLSSETLEKYAKNIEVTGCDPAVIDVSAMYKPAFSINSNVDAGKSFDNAIIREYTGDQLFKTRDEYKLAVVNSDNSRTLLAEKTDDRIRYTWQRFTGEYAYIYKDEEGKFIDENGEVVEADDSRYIKDEQDDSVLKEPLYEDYYYYGYNPDVEYTSTPRDVADYRIRVSYEDPQKQYYADDKYVYYTIQKKNILVLLDGAVEEYEGVTVGNFIDKITYTYASDGTREYVKHKIVGGTVVEGQDGSYTFTPDEKSINLYEWSDYELCWYVERLIKEGSAAGTYVRLNNNDSFIKGETYRLCVNFGDENEYLYNWNYNNRYALDEHNNYKIDADGNNILAYENDKLDITVNETKGIRLSVEVDWSKVADLTKVYDGKSLSFADTGINNAVIVTDPKDGSLVNDADIALQWFYRYDDEYDSRYVDESNAVHVGDYYLNVIVEQDANYAYGSYTFNGEDDKKFTILPRELTVAPVLKEDIKAGTYISRSTETVRQLCAADPKVTGYEDIIADRKFFEEDKIFVTEAIFSPRAFYNLSLSVYEKTAENQFSGYLRSSKSYNVSYTGGLTNIYEDHDDWEEQVFWARDYKVVFETVAFTPVRDTSSVESVAANGIVQTRLNDSISGDAQNGYTHTITPREGVEYSLSGYYYDEDGEKKELRGNYFVFKITAPKEYNSVTDSAANVVYENSIKNAGYLLNVGTSNSRAVYTVAFDASAKDQKKFEIIWENGYKENFVVDFTNCILMDDLSKAVAPKGIAFNGATSKMVVGESQQLDLKITKKQMSDVICILYESSDESVVEVSDRGYVTAIKKGQATITAYPAYVADGKKEKLTDAKGNVLKGAVLKITVSELAAVKAIKTEPHDTYAYLSYTVPTGGYRREIYVLKSSKTEKKTAQDFEEEIEKVTNGNYDAFVTKPIFCTGETGTWLSKGVKYYHKITNLEPGQQYTVYVRNVGVLRTTAAGYKSESKPAGAVSTFTTTKAQEAGLLAYFDTEKTNVYEKDDEYYVNISAKKVPLSVYARFLENKDYSDEWDYVLRTLPLTKDEQTTYINPKLTYYVSDNVYEEEDWEDKTQLKIGGYVFRPTSKIASIDKKGNISLKGVGLVYVLVYNAETQHIDVVELNIAADADSLTGKNIKLKVGNKVRLTDYLTYKQGNIALNGYCNYEWQDLVIDYVPNDSYELTFQRDRYSGAIKECWITAKKADKKKFEISVSDNNVIKNGGKAAKVVVTSAAIDPVKQLKSQDVVDVYGSVIFSYTAYNDFKTETDGDKLAFRIEVKDSTGKMLKRELVNEASIREYGKYDGYADAKHTTYQYRYRVTKLTRLSNYTVSVYAVYGDDQSKAVTTKLKTTNIPASYADVSDKNVIEGGANINVSVRDDSIIALAEHPLLKTGNKYTLSLPLDDGSVNRDAALMKTDTLTWKSSNTKAATVKANAGSFTATLTAVKKGTTTISVTSKVTKKVIAKWVVVVNAVGEAEGYYGDNVLKGYEYNVPGNLDNSGAEVLTRNNSLTMELQYGERRWVAFTAPECGNYSVSVNNGYFSVYKMENMQLLEIESFTRVFDDVEMEKGDTYYFYIENLDSYKKSVKYTFTAGGTEYKTVAIGGETKVRGGSSIRFTAPADNYYTFTIKQNGDEVDEVNVPLRAGESYTFTVAGDSSREYSVEVTARKPEKAISAGDAVAVSLTKDGEVWYQFTADQTSRYTFVTENAAKNIEADLFDSLYDEYGRSMGHYVSGEGDNASSNNVTIDREMKKGETVYIRLTSEEANTATLKVIQAAVVEKGKEQSVTIAADGSTKYVTFEVPKDGEYRFTSSYTKPASLPEGEDVQVEITVCINGDEVSWIYGAGTYECTLSKGDVVRFDVWADKKDTKVTIDVEETSVRKAEYDTPTGAIKISDGVNEWLTFTATEGNGWYDFGFTVEKKADGTVPDVQAEFYDKGRTDYKGYAAADGSETFKYVEYLEAGTVRTIKLASSETTEVSVSMKVTKETVDKLENGRKYTLDPKETKRLSWKADQEGVYNFGAKITPEDELTMMYSEVPNRLGRQITSLDEISGYMKKGETFYLTLIAADTLTSSDKKVAFEAEVKGQEVISLTAGEPKPIDVDPESVQWVEFTAKKTQRYEYAKADADGFRIYKGNSLEDYDGEEISFSGDDKYTAGQKQLFRIENTNQGKKTIKLTISEVVPVDFVQNQASTTMKHGEGKWFRFKAEALGRYQFTAEAKSGDKNAEAVFTKYTADLLSIAEDGLYESTLDNKIVKAGAYAYLYVVASIEDEDTTGDITITLNALAISQVESSDKLEVNKEKDVEFTAVNETKYLEFTASEDGLYTFMATKDGQRASGLTVVYYKNIESDAKYGSTEFNLSLEKNDKLIIKLTSAEVQKVQVKIQKETVTKITEDAKEYSISDGESLWFSVDSGEALRYFIEAFEAQDGLTLTMECKGGSWRYSVGNQSGNGFYYSYVGSVGGAERLIKITAAVASGDADSGQTTPKTFKIKKGLVAAEAMVSGDSKKIEVAKTEPNHMVWYRFTPEESGRYVIKAGGESSVRVREFTNGMIASTGTVQSAPYETIIRENQVGKERIYAVYYTSKEADDFNFSIYQAVEKNLTEAAPVAVDTAAVEAGEKIWVRFKAPADGRYTFTNDSGINIYTNKYETIDSNNVSGWAFDWDDEICMSEGEEILFAAYYYSVPEKDSFSISVSSVKPQELTVSETPKQIEFSDNNVKWFVFTAPAASIYQFDMTVSENENSADVSMYRYMKLNDQNFDYMYSGQTYGMSAGEKIYLKMQPSGVTDGKLTVSYQITPTAEIMKLDLTDNTIADIAAGSEKWAYFRADETGFYNFAISGSCAVGRYNDVNSGSMADYTDGDSFAYGLYKNEAIYFKVSNETGETAEEKITIAKGDEIRELVAGDSDRVNVTNEKTAWYVLTVSETGLYKIAADNDNAVLKEYTGLNELYPMTTKYGSYYKELYQGETVYINVSVTSSIETELSVSCTKLIEQSFTGDGEVEFTLNQGEAAIVEWFADSRGYYNFGYSASRYISYKYYQDGYGDWDNWYGAGESNYYYPMYATSVENGGSRYLILESGYNGNRVTVSAAKTMRQLNIGVTSLVELDGNETETFRFTAGYTGDYVFRSENGDDVYAYLRDTDDAWLAADTNYSGEGNNFRMIYHLTEGTEVRLEVHNGAYYSDSFYVGVYRYVQEDVTLGDDCSYTDTITTENYQEVWIKFTASKDGFHEFGYGDNYYGANLKLYALDGNGLGEALGAKNEGSTDVIKTWLDAGEEVMLRSYYYYHSSGTYQVTVRPAEVGVDNAGNWSISASYGSGVSKYLSISGGYEAAIPCGFSRSGKYTFYSYDEELIFELYVDGSKIDTDSTSRIEFEYDAALDGDKTVELRVHKGRKYQEFSGYVYASCDYLRSEYQMSLTGLEDVTISYGHEAWIEFEVPESDQDVRYTFTFENTNTSNSNTYYAYRYSDPEDENSEATVYFGGYYDAGSGVYGVPAGVAESVYWRIRNTNNADLTLTVTVNRTSVTPLSEAGVSEEIEAGGEKWFAFKAEEAGEYDFSFGCDTSCYVIGYQDISGDSDHAEAEGKFDSSNSYGYSKEFEQGETIYWMIENGPDTPANIAIRVKKNEDAVLSLADQEGTTAVIYPHLTQWFSFRSEEEARYTFTVKNTNANEEDTSSYYAAFYSEKDTSSGTWLGNINFGSSVKACELYIPSDETVYCYINNGSSYDEIADDLSVAVAVEKVPVNEWTTEPVDLAPGEEKWFSYTSTEEEAAKYTFTFTSTSEYYWDVQQYSDLNANGESLSGVQNIVRDDEYNYTRTKEYYLEANGKVYWKIQNSSSTDMISVKMKAEKIDITALTLGSADESGNVVPVKSAKWFSFKPDQSARYAFTFNSSFSVGVSMYTALDASTSQSFDYGYSGRDYLTMQYSGSEYAGTESWYIPAGETVYWKVSNDGLADTTVKAAVEKVEAVEMTEAMATDGIKIPGVSEKWIKFTADESARYVFTLTSNGTSTFYAYLYEDLTQESKTAYVYHYSGSSVDYEYYLEKDEPIYWKVPNTYSGDFTLTIKAEPIAVESLELSQSIEISLDADYMWMSFDVVETGIYKFTVTNNAGSVARIVLDRYAALDSTSSNRIGQVYSDTTETYQYSFAKGMKVYLKVTPYSSSASAEGTISVEKIAGAQTLEIGTGTEVSVNTETVKYQVLEFTAEEDGTYEFYSDGDDDTKAWFFNELDIDYASEYYQMNNLSNSYDDNSGIGNNFSKKIALTAGKTIYVVVGHPYLNSDITTTVYAEKTGGVKVLTLGESARLNVDSGEYQWYSFTAPADGDYIFYSDDSSGDPKAWFFQDTSIGNDATSDELNLESTNGGYGYDDDNNGGLTETSGNNFAKKISMTEGQTIYVAVGRYDLSGSVNANIHVINTAGN